MRSHLSARLVVQRHRVTPRVFLNLLWSRRSLGTAKYTAVGTTNSVRMSALSTAGQAGARSPRIVMPMAAIGKMASQVTIART